MHLHFWTRRTLLPPTRGRFARLFKVMSLLSRMGTIVASRRDDNISRNAASHYCTKVSPIPLDRVPDHQVQLIGHACGSITAEPHDGMVSDMTGWPDQRVLDLFGIDLPIIQAPMAGATTIEMVVAAGQAGGLGSLPSAQLTVDQLKTAILSIRASIKAPLNVNFFAHQTLPVDAVAQLRWRALLAPYYVEFDLDPAAPVSGGGRAPFDEAFCEVVEEYRPEVVSFHFGLPAKPLVDRVKAAGAKVVSSATTVAEALWLEANGADVVIAMGAEAGGHRGNFLTHDMSTQVGTMALVPQIVDAVAVPVIAAGGIADGRGVAAASMLGACAVQVGTAYLFCPEAKISTIHAQALAEAGDDSTAHEPVHRSAR